MTEKQAETIIEPRAFWEARYPAWDLNRYGFDKKAMPLIYRLTRNPPDAVRFRKDVVLEHIKEHFQGKHIVEIGCGSGRISHEIINCGAASYHGIDFSQNAIDIAKENAKETGMSDRTSFEQADISNKSLIKADLIFSSGFISWLTDEQIDHMFKITRQSHFLHTITERRFEFRQIIKNIYLHITKADPYLVRYFSVADIERYLEKHRDYQMHVLRHKKLYTIAYLSSLPFPAKLITN